ncbi:hypothetical protein [Chitinilyticum piscinae]|uniref:Porin n=1 Tax=Chitinilyticum piscinae TaxID=2866724 RepID=A0A8J7KDC1_9NEIS|nr:hypothetical protein [Chitinilyticum piscinae]MBE9608634.1 hypothetical protein [Chitinilyticum piscinae]
MQNKNPKPIRHHVSNIALLLLALLPGRPALAQAAGELDALALADNSTASAAPARDWQFFAELMAGGQDQRTSGWEAEQRLSLDLNADVRFAPDWRAVLSDRLDLGWSGWLNEDNQVNTLREAYLSWQPDPAQIYDLGRINLRSGVATGFNPTDFFKAGALRSVTSIAPASLRENRLGSGMLRGQWLWDGGSVSALYSPRLADQRSTAPFSADFGASNASDRGLLVFSQAINDWLNPQGLIYAESGAAPQLGMNLSLLASDATVLYVEYAGGRAASQIDQALGVAGPQRFQSQLATGLTQTFANKLSVTVEYQYSSAAPDAKAWQALQHDRQAYGMYRAWAGTMQALTTEQALFTYASWQDFPVTQSELAAMIRHDLTDQSSLVWLQAMYHLEHADLIVQWQYGTGDAFSVYGASPASQTIQAMLRYYF